MKIRLTLILFALVLAPLQSARAFCGFFVAKADTQLFNKASQVVLVRDGNRTVITMASDYKGSAKDFALVVPVPTFVEKKQIHVTDRKHVQHLDAFTSPRLVEYFDPDPCARPEIVMEMAPSNAAARGRRSDKDIKKRAKNLGVTIEASYTVGEYDILILSAKQSDGLATWLNQEGYKLPPGAARVLGGYLKQGMRFFVAKVNLKEHSRIGFSTLRPIQVAYESPKFMLPIRLGMVNADGPQELFVYTLTKTGRVETTNYRTVKLPTGSEIPPFVKEEFGDFYKAMFAEALKKENNRAVFLEYAWDMNWCDPCAADPLSAKELRELGVFWAPEGNNKPERSKAAAQNAYVTRLHLRYTGDTFPEDLVFQETGDRSNFQGRYVLRQPFKGEASCEAADHYYERLTERQEREAQTLANLTGWEMRDIRKKVPKLGKTPSQGDKWWEQLWKD